MANIIDLLSQIGALDQKPGTVNDAGASAAYRARFGVPAAKRFGGNTNPLTAAATPPPAPPGGWASIGGPADTGDDGSVMGDIWGFVKKAIDVVDTPRAFAVSAIKEGFDATFGRAEAGSTWGEAEGAEEQSASWDDFVSQGWRNIGFGEIVEDYGDMPHAAKVAVGFAGDVAADPLTYLGAGMVTKGAAKGSEIAAKQLAVAARSGGRDAIAKQLARRANEVGITGSESVARLVGEAAQRGTGALTTGALKRAGVSADEIAQLGIGELRTTLFGAKIPGSRLLSEAGAGARGVAKMKLGQTKRASRFRATRITDQGGEAAWIDQLRRAGVDDATRVKAAQGLLSVNASRQAPRKWADTTAKIWRDRFAKDLGGLDEAGRRAAVHAWESGSKDGLSLQLRRFFDETFASLREAGVDVAYRKGYVPHLVTDEFREAVRKNPQLAVWITGPQTRQSIQETRHLGKGEIFMGVKLKKGTIEEINSISVDTVGARLFEDDLLKVFERYLVKSEATVMAAAQKKALIEFGAATPIPVKKKNGKAVKRSVEEKAAIAEAKQAALQAEWDEAVALSDGTLVRQSQAEEVAAQLRQRIADGGQQEHEITQEVFEQGRQRVELADEVEGLKVEIVQAEAQVRAAEVVVKAAEGGAPPTPEPMKILLGLDKGGVPQFVKQAEAAGLKPGRPSRARTAALTNAYDAKVAADKALRDARAALTRAETKLAKIVETVDDTPAVVADPVEMAVSAETHAAAKVRLLEVEAEIQALVEAGTKAQRDAFVPKMVERPFKVDKRAIANDPEIQALRAERAQIVPRQPGEPRVSRAESAADRRKAIDAKILERTAELESAQRAAWEPAVATEFEPDMKAIRKNEAMWALTDERRELQKTLGIYRSDAVTPLPKGEKWAHLSNAWGKYGPEELGAAERELAAINKKLLVAYSKGDQRVIADLKKQWSVVDERVKRIKAAKADIGSYPKPLDWHKPIPKNSGGKSVKKIAEDVYDIGRKSSAKEPVTKAEVARMREHVEMLAAERERITQDLFDLTYGFGKTKPIELDVPPTQFGPRSATEVATRDTRAAAAALRKAEEAVSMASQTVKTAEGVLAKAQAVRPMDAGAKRMVADSERALVAARGRLVEAEGVLAPLRPKKVVADAEVGPVLAETPSPQIAALESRLAQVRAGTAFDAGDTHLEVARVGTKWHLTDTNDGLLLGVGKTRKEAMQSVVSDGGKWKVVASQREVAAKDLENRIATLKGGTETSPTRYDDAAAVSAETPAKAGVVHEIPEPELSDLGMSEYGDELLDPYGEAAPDPNWIDPWDPDPWTDTKGVVHQGRWRTAAEMDVLEQKLSVDTMTAAPAIIDPVRAATKATGDVAVIATVKGTKGAKEAADATFDFAVADTEVVADLFEKTADEVEEIITKLAAKPVAADASIEVRRAAASELGNQLAIVRQMFQAAGDDETFQLLARMEAQAAIYDMKAIAAGKAAFDADAFLKTMKDPKFTEHAVLQAQDGYVKLTDTHQIPVWMNDILQVEHRMKELPKAVQQFSKFMNLWKGWATASPGFLNRNIYGGLMGIWLEGGTTALANTVKFGRFWKIYVNNPDNYMDLAKAKFGPAMAERMDTALHVVFGTGGGQVPAEVMVHAAKPLHRGLMPTLNSINPASVDNVVIRTTRAASTNIEGVMRGGHAFDVLSRGGTADLAQDVVTKWHFNYMDLSSLDQGIKRYGIPFWTFYSRNLALQAHVWSHMPAKLNRSYFNAKRNIELGQDDDEVRPQYFDELGGIQMGDESESTPWWIPDLPSIRAVSDAEKLLHPQEMRWMGDLNPILKLPIEQMGGRQSFSGIPFKDSYTQDGAERSAPTWAQIPGIEQILSGLGAVEHNASGNPVMTDRVQYMAESLMPGLGQLNRLVPTQARMKDKHVQNLLNYLGVGYKENNESTRQGELYRRSKEAEADAKRRKDLGL